MAVSEFSGAVPAETYHGFSGPRHKVSGGEKRRRTITLIGVGVALVTGLAVGMLAKPKLITAPAGPMEAVEQTASTGPQLAIQVDRAMPAPIRPASKAEKLEVLPARLAQAAPRPPVVQAQPAEFTEEQALAPIDCAAPANLREARVCQDAFDESAPSATQLSEPRDD